MKYTKEERLEVGRKIYESGLSNLKVSSIIPENHKTSDSSGCVNHSERGC